MESRAWPRKCRRGQDQVFIKLLDVNVSVMDKHS